MVTGKFYAHRQPPNPIREKQNYATLIKYQPMGGLKIERGRFAVLGLGIRGKSFLSWSKIAGDNA